MLTLISILVLVFIAGLLNGFLDNGSFSRGDALLKKWEPGYHFEKQYFGDDPKNGLNPLYVFIPCNRWHWVKEGILFSYSLALMLGFPIFEFYYDYFIYRIIFGIGFYITFDLVLKNKKVIEWFKIFDNEISS
ncbi:MAG: hypothetical protein NUV97_01395 [archaeon]|nr:hypothetical protein [archaeon]